MKILGREFTFKELFRDQVTRMDLVFEPNNKSKKVNPINLTFLETSGENHNEIRRGGQYHSSISQYLKQNSN
ncbi:hypothetical protein CCAN2_2040042 [Capnocytophaga canimorsus]|nr:hypothetical protein CCAN2_2040042 [Capnocytophaga canimorsus]